MQKTKRAAQTYTCYTCKTKISKGDQYGKKSYPVRSTIHPAGQNAPAWAWETVRFTNPICVPCMSK